MIKAASILIPLCLAFASAASFIRQDVSSENWRVVGGQDAKPGQFPSIISLRQGATQSHTCGGSLIKYDWVVTAAHCVDSVTNASSLLVIAGSIELKSGGESREVVKIIIHEGWDRSIMENDIALLKLKTPYTETEYIKTIDLFCVSLDAPLDCILSGWGRTSYPGNIPNTLQTLNMKSITHQDCVQRMSLVAPYVIFKSQVCGLTKAGEGACHGDSGGPLLIEDDVKKQWLHGIVSWGSPCAKGVPDVYTRVSSFCEWVQQRTY